MSSEKNYDDLLFSILCTEGNIIGFLDKIFEFMFRRTDYFRLKTPKSPDMGFASGEAESIVKNVFCKYMKQAMTQYNAEMESEIVPVDFLAEEVVTTTIEDTDIVTDCKDEPSSKIKSIQLKEVDNCESEPKIPWMDPDSYNGAKFEDYCWAQTIKDVDLRIKVPKHVISAKQVQVHIHKGSITSSVLYNENWETLKNGDLQWKVNVEESTWTLVPGEHIHIYLLKIQDRWWDSLFPGEPKINMKSIDPSISYDDLDADSQAKISELMFNEHQKKLGKPTIQQNKIENILKGAWNAEGSPFKGQPFDPSIIEVQNAENLL